MSFEYSSSFLLQHHQLKQSTENCKSVPTFLLKYKGKGMLEARYSWVEDPLANQELKKNLRYILPSSVTNLLYLLSL